MRVLLVSNTFPADPDRAVHGIYQRLDTFMHAMRGHRVEALFFVPDDVDVGEAAARAARLRLAETWGIELDLELCRRAPPRVGHWATYFAGMLSMSDQARYQLTSGAEQIAAVRRCLAREPDALFVHRLTAMAPLLELPAPGIPTFFDLDDVEHVAFERRVRTPRLRPGERLLRLQLPALRRGERQAIDRSTVTFVCSDSDRDYLRTRYRTDAVETVPNSVPIPPSDALEDVESGPPCVLFLGNYAHPPNRAAAERMATLWPTVRARVPTAHLLLAGPEPELLSCYGADAEGIEFPGFIDDLEAVYKRTTLVCAPILEGGGTRIKLLEAAAWARPIVGTKIAAEGIGFEDGVHYLERDDDGRLIDACVELLRGRLRAAQLGRAARRFVTERYSKEAVTESIRRLFAGRGLPAVADTLDA